MLTTRKERRITQMNKLPEEEKMNEKEWLEHISNQLNILTDVLLIYQNNASVKNRSPAGKTGRPTKGHIVRIYRMKYPKGLKMQCVRETGLSIKTVSKYWHEQEEPVNTE
jgi:hypothetical protein